MYFHFLIHAIAGQSAPVPTALKEIHMTLASRWPRWWLKVKTMHYWLKRSMGFPKVQKVYRSRWLFLSQKHPLAKANDFWPEHDQNFVPKMCHNFLQWRIEARDNYAIVDPRWSLLVTETWNLFSSEPFSRGDEVPTQVIQKCDSCQGDWRRDCNRKNGRIWPIAWVLKHRISDIRCFWHWTKRIKKYQATGDLFGFVEYVACSACWEPKQRYYILDEYIRLFGYWDIRISG